MIKKKVGVLLQNTKCNPYFYKTISELSNKNADLFFLINDSDSLLKQVKVNLLKRVESIFKSILFKLIIFTEKVILQRKNSEIGKHFEIFDISCFNNREPVILKPIFSKSGIFVKYSEKDIIKIQDLDLDIIVRGNAPGIFQGEILKISKQGIISFHHGDNNWNRGSPPAFWEVYHKKPSTGFIIQILNSELDGGTVVYKGSVTTKRTYVENLVSLYSESYPCLSHFIMKEDFSDNFQSTVFSNQLLKKPTVIQSLTYIYKVVFAFFKRIFESRILKIGDRWGVAFVHSKWEVASLRKGVVIKNPTDHYYADPFVITKNDKTICYVEDYSRQAKKGCISAIEIFSNGEYKILGEIIKEEFHMSFPYIFEYENNLFMIPETSQSNSIRLYRCTDYPMKWEYQGDIFKDIDAADTMVFLFNNKWWLLTNTKGHYGNDHCSRLLAFYSDSPISANWTPHENNPIVFDSRIARNGGILFSKNGFVVRGRQKQDFNAYGASLSLSKIIQLTKNSFIEEKITDVNPEFFKKIKGCHHMHANDEYTVYDFMKREGWK